MGSFVDNRNFTQPDRQILLPIVTLIDIIEQTPSSSLVDVLLGKKRSPLYTSRKDHDWPMGLVNGHERGGEAKFPKNQFLTLCCVGCLCGSITASETRPLLKGQVCKGSCVLIDVDIGSLSVCLSFEIITYIFGRQARLGQDASLFHWIASKSKSKTIIMASNGAPPVFILYKVINAEADAGDPCFNAFLLPHGVKPTLASIKQLRTREKFCIPPKFVAHVFSFSGSTLLLHPSRYCTALYGMNHLGPDGYHWRICMQDRPVPGDAHVNVADLPTSWWDIQDESATLPIKESTQYQLHKFLHPPPKDNDGGALLSEAKATFKSLGKVMSHAVGAAADHHHDGGPTVRIVAFKLLDLIKVNDDFTAKHRGSSAGPAVSSHQRAAPPQQQRPPPQQHRPPPQQQQPSQQQHRAPPAPSQQQPQRPAPTHRQQPSEPSLMDFGPTTSAPTNRSTAHHHHHPSHGQAHHPKKNESRAEKLKREYAVKNQTASRVWDDVDQRWVEKDANVAAKSDGAKPTNGATAPKKVVGITLDPANAIGKSAKVQAAVQQRVDSMKMEQDKAVNEVREREAKKKQMEAEEDEVRKRLEPKIKVWSEEHGKKKQLRALLASLHTILWPGAKWKQVTIGDLLDDKKVLKCFQRASLVVHPDKTGHLDSEQRFLAKRVFDALCQAKAQFDDGK
jgi:hypothetical protein